MRDTSHAPPFGVFVSRPPSGPLQRLIRPFVNPGTLDYWAQHLSANWSWDRPLAQVVSRHVEARDTVTLTLKPNRHVVWPKPGQHINVSVEVNGRRQTRSYSPTRIDARGGTLDITVKHVPAGLVSSQLCQRTQAGDMVELGEPFGQMTWSAPIGGKWLLLAAGSGITPMISLIRQAKALNSRADIVLIYAARQRADLCFMTELQEWSRGNPQFRTQILLSRESQLLSHEMGGRLDASVIQSVITDLPTRQVLACGPAGFVDTAQALTETRAQQFLAEAFTPPVMATSADEPLQTVNIVLQQSGRTVAVSTGQALLPALEAHGLQVPHGCRMGVCNSCSCDKVEGTTRNLQSGDLDNEPHSAVRLCVSSARTDLTLDL